MGGAVTMRAAVLGGVSDCPWEVGPRSAAELKEAATHWDRSAELCPAPAVKAQKARFAGLCRSKAEAM